MAATKQVPVRQSGPGWQEIVLFGVGGFVGALLGAMALIQVIDAIIVKSSAFWFVSRAAGIMAYVLLWATTAWGLIVSTRGIEGALRSPVPYNLHSYTAWLALVFSGLHGIALLGDRFVTFTLSGILVPFASSYQPFYTGIGVLAFYLSAVLILSFYIKKTIGQRVWRLIHYLTFLAFGMVTLHGAALGTDSGSALMQFTYILAGGSVLFLTVFRILTAGSRRGPALRQQTVR